MEPSVGGIGQALSSLASELASLLLSPYSTLWWVYLVSTLAIAASVYLLRDAAPGQRSLACILRACLPRSIYATRSFRQDVAMCLVNVLLHSLFLGSMILSTVWVEQQVWQGLHDAFGAVEHRRDGWAAMATLTLAVVLAVDLGFFLSHYLQHKTPWLWQFHKVHHSAETLNPFTTFRRHPVDLMIDGNITGLLTGATLGLFDYLSFGGLEMATIAGVNAGIFLFLMTTAHLQHSHVWLSYGPLNRLVVSPAMHQIHHSRDPRHLDKNFGNIFSVWDALAGTRYLPRAREALRYGLAHDDVRPYERLWQFYVKPFVETGRMIPMRTKMPVAVLLGCSVAILLLAGAASFAADPGQAGAKVTPKGATAVVAPMFTPKREGAKGVVAPMFTPKRGSGAKGAVAPMFTPKAQQGTKGVVAPIDKPEAGNARGVIAPMFTPKPGETRGVVAPMFTPQGNR